MTTEADFAAGRFCDERRPRCWERVLGVSPAEPVALQRFVTGASAASLNSSEAPSRLRDRAFHVSTCSVVRAAPCPARHLPSRTLPLTLLLPPGPRRPSCSGTSAGASTTSSWLTT